jgi:hypothetical protein
MNGAVNCHKMPKIIDLYRWHGDCNVIRQYSESTAKGGG